MKELLHSARLLVADLASTLVFLILMPLTHNLALSVGLSMAVGAAQILYELVRKRPIHTVQWMSLAVVVVSGTATLLTDSPRFVMIKPTLLYAAAGVVLVKRGWMNRYLPAIAIEVVPDLGVAFGYVWAALMFLSALVNLGAVAMNMDIVTWAAWTSIWGIASKTALFWIQFATMRIVGRRRRRTQMAAAGFSTP